MCAYSFLLIYIHATKPISAFHYGLIYNTICISYVSYILYPRKENPISGIPKSAAAFLRILSIENFLQYVKK